MEKRPAPIAVRPRQGSALEQVWDEKKRSNREMGDVIHSWAESFRLMTKEEEER